MAIRNSLSLTWVLRLKLRYRDGEDAVVLKLIHTTLCGVTDNRFIRGSLRPHVNRHRSVDWTSRVRLTTNIGGEKREKKDAGKESAANLLTQRWRERRGEGYRVGSRDIGTTAYT